MLCESCVPLGTYRQQSLSPLADHRAGPFPTHQGLIEGVLLEFEKNNYSLIDKLYITIYRCCKKSNLIFG